mgnify:CR=1 FL=1
MTLTQIHALLAVLEYGGFTEASKRLYMTQSAVSQAISALEEELGVDILIRERRKDIQLSPAGVGSFHTCGRSCLNQRGEEIAEQERQNPARTLRIGCFPSAYACYFARHHPPLRTAPPAYQNYPL